MYMYMHTVHVHVHVLYTCAIYMYQWLQKNIFKKPQWLGKVSVHEYNTCMYVHVLVHGWRVIGVD